MSYSSCTFIFQNFLASDLGESSLHVVQEIFSAFSGCNICTFQAAEAMTFMALWPVVLYLCLAYLSVIQ